MVKQHRDESPEASASSKRPKRESNNDEIIAQRPERTTALETNPDTLSRNKRLFGSLMGHLGSAKKLLEKDSTKIEIQGTLLYNY